MGRANLYTLISPNTRVHFLRTIFMGLANIDGVTAERMRENG